MQVNSGLLTETVDPKNVLMKLFSHKLISLEEMEEIKKIQAQSGKKEACEEMICFLLKEWKSETYNIFLEVLNSCDYEECTAQLQSNPITNTILPPSVSAPILPSIFPSYSVLSLLVSFIMHVFNLCTESYEGEALGGCVTNTDERNEHSYEGNNVKLGVAIFL